MISYQLTGCNDFQIDETNLMSRPAREAPTKGIEPADWVVSIEQSAKLLRVTPALLDAMLRKPHTPIPAHVQRLVRSRLRPRRAAARTTV
jgi:hypothetical protein